MSNRLILRYCKNLVKYNILLFIPLLLNSCKDKDWDPVIIRNSSTYRSENSLQSETMAAKNFITKYINSYLKEVERKVIPKFRDSLYISANKKYKARLITSSESESYLYLVPSDTNELTIDFTEFPSQLALILHIGIFGNNQLSLDKKSVINHYKDSDAAFRFRNGTVSIKDMRFQMGVKPFATDSCVMLFRNVSFKYDNAVFNDNNTKTNKLLETHLNYCFFTGDKSFAEVLHYADSLGISEAQNDIIDLYIKSSFFRKALAHKELRKLSDEIVEKKSRSDKDSHFDYPFWEFQIDKKALEDLVKKNGIELSYADSILMESLSKKQDGYLFFYYHNHFEFMIIWSGFNLFFTLVIFFLSTKKFRNKTLATIFNAFTIFINISFFTAKPASLHFNNFILPFVLLIIYELIYSYLLMKK